MVLMPSARPQDVNAGLATPEEMQTAIEESGYLLEGRIARIMADRGFFVQPNYFTPDPVQADNALEIDVAGSYFEVLNEDNKDTASASVLVECKNNSQPFAFFAQRQQLIELNENRIHYGGFPSFSMDQETGIQVPLHELVKMKDWHHYCKGEEVVTQFCGFKWINDKRPKKWKAEPMEHYSKSFSKLATVTALDSKAGYELSAQNIQVQISFPIAVFQGPIYRVRDEGGKAKLETAEHLQLHHSTSMNGRVIQVQIDVVTEASFSKLIETILDELRAFRERMNTIYARLLNSARDQKSVALQNSMRETFKDYLGSRGSLYS